jgi:peptide/nickel transport system ATP-binding protein
MYVGKIVELAETDDLFDRPKHPYTEALLSAVPQPGTEQRMQRIVLAGDVADPANRPSGCAFHPRCLYARAVCRENEPPLRTVEDETGPRQVACHFADDLELKGVRGRLSDSQDAPGSTPA